MKTLLKLALAGLFIGGSVANAAVVNFTIDGIVNSADAGNVFNLSAGNTISASGSFDDSVLSGGDTGTVLFDMSSGNSLSLSFGTMTFQASDDIDYASGNPFITLNAGSLTAFDFAANVGTLGYLTSFELNVDAEDDSYNFVNATWTGITIDSTTVPVPAAVWLFGSGLLGLVGFARRKAA